MKKSSFVLSKSFSLGVILAFSWVARADFNPLALTPGSFNADVVVERTASPTINNFVNVTMDGGTNNNSNTWFEQGYDASRPWSGLPPQNTSFFAADGSAHQFRMGNYAVNNSLCVFSALPSGTLKLTTPAAYSVISVLNSGGGGASTINYTIHYSGGGTQAGTLDVNDWFNNTAYTIAWYSCGRVSVSSAQINAMSAPGTGAPRLFYSDILLADPINNVISIDFSSSSGNRAVIFGLSGSSDGSSFLPLAITGYNSDLVVEATAPRTASIFTATTATLDAGTNNWDFTYYETGFGGQTGSGLPHPGASFTVGSGPTHTFTMAPNYAANDCVLVDPAVTTATLVLTSPRAFTGLSFLNSCGGGSALINVVVHHGEANAEGASFTAQDWFNGATPAYANGGRFRLQDLNFDIRAGSKLWLSDVALTDTTTPVTSIEFTYAGSGAHAAIFAVGGSTDGANYTPVDVTGWNQDVIVEASQPLYPAAFRGATTVTMDGGTNNTGNTWYEQGYYSVMPSSGLPAAGSTLTSLDKPDHHYQLAPSYAANNAIYVDATHTEANLTIASPANYSALSFLSATANGWVTNACIMQYLDGTTESNYFVSADWFNNNPYAFSPRGRVNTDNGTVNNDPGRSATPNPRLYEAQFALSKTTSPVTNVVLKFLGAQNSASGRMAVFAVSATAGAVPPIIAAGSPASVTTIEGSNVVLSAQITGGTLPITSTWLYSADGVGWSGLSDAGFISGSTTPNLTNSSIGWTNAGQYKFVAQNAAGYATSAVAVVTVRSGLPDVTQPADAITAFGGGSTAGEGVGNVIDNTTSKYLNTASGGTPFTGPVGFVVKPSLGKTTVSILRLYTANDATGRDPADYTLEGSNDDGATWTTIASGPLALPDGRNNTGQALNSLTQFLQEVRFANATGYTSYRVGFATIKDNAGTSLMQIGEVELLGTQTPEAPVITVQPVASAKVLVGASPTFSVVATGYPTNFTYQWYLGGSTPISGATASSYTFPNAQLSDSGKTFSCRVNNSQGTANSSSAQLTVIARPTQPYPVAVINDNPAGFWRLNEGPDNGAGNNGTVANDYLGGHAGVYNNTLLGVPGYNSANDVDTAATFAYYAAADSYVGSIPGLSFAAVSNNNVAFTVEAWVKGPQQAVDAGLITKGFGGGGEQFNLDCGGGANHSFRFFVREASGGTFGAIGSKGPDDQWHHVVGVLDEANSNIVLYVDGIPNATGSATPYAGLLHSPVPVSIGSRQSGQGTAFDNQFNGTIDEVAIYPYALSSNQVLSHYYAASPGPLFSLQPTNTTVSEGNPVTFYSLAYGPGTLGYQWYQSIDGGITFTTLAGKTAANLVLAAVPAAYNGNQYQVVVNTLYGTVTSAPAILTVVSGPPQILADLPSQTVVYAGRTFALAVTVGGSAPFTYQWQSNGVNLTDNARVSGSHSNVLTIVNAQVSDSGTYQLIVNNLHGSGASSADAVSVVARVGFNGTGGGWALNGGAFVNANALTLTDGGASEARSSFFNYPLYVQAFKASFTYQDTTPGGGGADGFSFCLQNDSRGATALGGAGGALALSGITPSAAFTFNIYGGAPGGVGMSFGVNGGNGNPYTATDPVGIAGGNPVDVTVVYNAGTAQVTLKDDVVGLTFTTNILANLPALVGADTAFVGFTGASGGIGSSQEVRNFSFIPYVSASAHATATNTVMLTWPGAVGGYVLQSTTSLHSPNWQPVPATITSVNGNNQVIIGSPGGSAFFRLVLP